MGIYGGDGRKWVRWKIGFYCVSTRGYHSFLNIYFVLELVVVNFILSFTHLFPLHNATYKCNLTQRWLLKLRNFFFFNFWWNNKRCLTAVCLCTLHNSAPISLFLSILKVQKKMTIFCLKKQKIPCPMKMTKK